MNDSKITVLMGIYNCADTLSEALDSLLNQTFTHWQCILCDDCSSDNTYDIAKDYYSRYPNKFKLIKNEKNLGLNKVLNKCLALADTDYVARMDGDDISLPTRFEKEFEFLEQNPNYDIVSSSMIQFDENGDFRTGKVIASPSVTDIVTKSVIAHAAVMIRTSAIKAVGGYSEDTKLLRIEDVDLWIKLYENNSRCFNIQEPLYKMRDDRNAVNRRKYKYRINSTRRRLKACKSFNLGIKYKLKCIYPMIIGLLPKPLYVFLHKRKNNKSTL